jgi:hypothetical protein
MGYYARKHSTLSNADAAICGPELTKIEEENGGLTPRMVVVEATNPRSPLHSQFEWDDTVAAINHRDEQARRLIRNIMVHVTIDDEVQDIRLFLNVSQDKKRSYRNISYVANDDDLKNQVVEQAHVELERWRNKWGQYRQLRDLVDSIAGVQEEITYARASIRTEQSAAVLV